MTDAYAEITAGGHLEMMLGDLPNQRWGLSSE